jgi:hypothetical protein
MSTPIDSNMEYEEFEIANPLFAADDSSVNTISQPNIAYHQIHRNEVLVDEVKQAMQAAANQSNVPPSANINNKI